jgi:hypothetical protein
MSSGRSNDYEFETNKRPLLDESTADRGAIISRVAD